MPVLLGPAESRLALALLNLAQVFELEPGQEVHLTPSLSVEDLSGLTGLGVEVVSLWLDSLMRQGAVSQRRQRLILWDRPVLERLALGTQLI